MKTSALDKYLNHHKPLCKTWEFSLRQERHCTCGLEKARQEVVELRARIAELEAKLPAYEYFVISIRETFELHSSHWEFHVKKGLTELEEALKAKSAEEASP